MKTVIYIIFIIILLNSCATVETASNPMEFRIEFISPSLGDYKVYQHQGAGKFDLLSPLGGGTYDIKIPMMQGGYTKFLFLKFKNHDPNDYKVLQIKKNGELYKELSISEIRQLKSEKNIYKLKLQ